MVLSLQFTSYIDYIAPLWSDVLDYERMIITMRYMEAHHRYINKLIRKKDLNNISDRGIEYHIARAEQYVNSEPQMNVSVTGMSNAAGMSRSYFVSMYTKFRGVFTR